MNGKFTNQQRILSNSYTFSFEGKKYQVLDKIFAAFPGDALTVASGKHFDIQVTYRDQIYSVEEFVRVPSKENKPKMSLEELSKKRSEQGRLGRKASHFG